MASGRPSGYESYVKSVRRARDWTQHHCNVGKHGVLFGESHHPGSPGRTVTVVRLARFILLCGAYPWRSDDTCAQGYRDQNWCCRRQESRGFGGFVLSADPHPAENQEDKIFTPGPGTTSGYGRCVQSLWQPRGGLANLAQRMQLRHREPGTISVGSHLPRKATKLTPCEVDSRTLTSIFVSVAALSPGISQ